MPLIVCEKMKKYFKYIILISLVSCASNKNVTTDKNYSQETNRTFEMIERGGSYYLKEAPEYNPPPRVSVPNKRRDQEALIKEENEVEEKINYQAKPLTQEMRSAPSQQAERPVLQSSQTNSRTDERLIEINQNLAFFCMKHRKNPIYGGNEAKCMKYVNFVMNDCQKKHRIVNSKLLNCIQKKLKK